MTGPQRHEDQEDREEDEEVALAPTRYEFRIALADVDRSVELERAVVLSRHPSETTAHVQLRILAYCLLWDERLEFGPGLCDGEAPDLLARDLTGQLTMWVECGRADGQHLRRVRQRNYPARVVAVFGERQRLDEFISESEVARARGGKTVSPVEACLIDPALAEALEEEDEVRSRWRVTHVGGHLYIDTGRRSLDGDVTWLSVP